MEGYLKLLSEFVSFKTISTDPSYKPEIEACVEWLSQQFSGNGFLVEVWRGEDSNPVVFASYGSDPKKETILVYGHYDVQPAGEGWKGDPFIVREENGRLVARGVIDNKGQVLLHMHTVFELIKEGKLAQNIKFVLEGDEETGAGELSLHLKNKKAKLKADHVLISDGELVGDHPVVEVSFRGGFNLTLRYKTAKNNLHSGIYGSAAPNAVHELAKFIGGIYNLENKIAIPGFYEDVDPVTPEHVSNNRKLEKISREALGATGIKKFMLEKGYDFYTQTGLRPAIQVTGIKGGYIDQGYANIVPATAEARFNFRLVTSQDPVKVLKLFKSYVARVTPKYVDYEISEHGLHYPIKVDVTSDKTQHTTRLLRRTHGKEVLTKAVGGAIPIVADFINVLKANTILVPLVNEDCNMHGAEENFDINLLNKGLDFSRRFFSGVDSRKTPR